MRYCALFVLATVLAACAEPGSVKVRPPAPVVRVVDSGVSQSVDFFYNIDPHCQNLGFPEILVLTAPKHGAVSIVEGSDYPSFVRDNVRYECNRVKVPTKHIHYTSAAGYRGADLFVVRVRFVDSTSRNLAYNLTVQ